jgi:hypothetical protein
MHPFNTASKMKSIRKVVIFIEAGAARVAPVRGFSWECGENAPPDPLLFFVKTFSNTHQRSRLALRALSDAWLAAGGWRLAADG